MKASIVQLVYLVSTALFIFALYWMNHPKTARRAVYAGVAAILMAVLGTLFQAGLGNLAWMAGAVVLAFAVGIPLSQVPLTAVPQRTALSHAFGGAAAGLVGAAEYYLGLREGGASLTPFRMTAIIAEVILGFLTLTGSLMAAGKLQEVKWIPQRPVTYKFQNQSNLSLLAIAVLCGVMLVVQPMQLP